MKTTDIAWSAGFFEGEGSIFTERRTDRPTRRRLTVSIQSTDFDVLERMQKLWGGWIYEQRKRKPHHKRSYMWRITHRKAREFAMTCLCLLGRRRQKQVMETLNEETACSSTR